MKWLSIALAFVGAGALACPADDVKDAQAEAQAQPVAQAKAPVQSSTTAAKTVASKKAPATKEVVGKAAAETARKL
ncbi:MAG: hypothetical protein HS106_01295 [Ideonella sp.]|nr:hypothetical protein [Ideonella sp.]MBE7424696.1 hypothetical protein [Ideonella sp.]